MNTRIYTHPDIVISSDLKTFAEGMLGELRQAATSDSYLTGELNVNGKMHYWIFLQ